MKEARLASSEPAWLAEWIARAAELPPQRSIVLGSKCCADLKLIGRSISNYLNEFDEFAEGHWHSFSPEDLQHIAGDPACRDMLLSRVDPDARPGVPDSDLDRVARQIARLGGAVIEGQYGLDATRDLDQTYRVCLCAEHPVCLQPCHIWINPSSFPTTSLVAVIADSFLDWTSRRPPFLGSNPSSNAQDPANRAEPDSRRCGSL